MVALVLMSLVLQFPPAGWRLEGWQGAAAAASERDFPASEMLKTSSYYGLWLCFIIGSLSGLMAIGISSNVGQEIIKLTPATAAGLVSFFALFNGGGRPLFGWLSDVIGHSKAAALSLLLIVLASGAMVLFAREGTVVLYAACFAAFWMGLGSWLPSRRRPRRPISARRTMRPTTASFFPPMESAQSWPVRAGFAKDIFGSYIHAFHVSGSLATVGVIIALTLMKEPKTA